MLIGLLLLGCTNTDSSDNTIKFCSGSRKAMYDPLHLSEMWSFPDDFYTMPDHDSPTGRVVDLSETKAPWATNLSPLFADSIAEMSTRSGFARLGSVVLRFTGPVGSGPLSAEESLSSTDIMWYDTSVSPPERVAFSVITSEFQNQLILKPVKPLRANAEQTIVITTDFTDIDGSCIAPADLIKEMIRGTATEPYLEKQNQTQLAIDKLGLDPNNISHIVTYTTHDDLQVFSDIARSIPSQDYHWDTNISCDDSHPTHCERSFTANDYRDEGAVSDGEIHNQWSIPVQIWLPKDLEPPYPTIIYGHGLNSRAQEATGFASRMSELGVAVVAIDAMRHGQHPSAETNATLPALDFLGLNLSNFQFDARGLRGNFDQSALDRLQLLALLKQDGDLDGDGTLDVEAENILYYGVSLGGLMGPHILANSDIGAGVLFVAGGDLPVFTTDTTTIEGLDSLLQELIGPPDVFNRMIPLMQTSVDSADPAVWGAHVLHNRFNEHPAPDVLFPVCLTDDTVPPATAKALAHGLGLPQMTPVLDEVPLLEIVEAPLRQNLDDGATGAYFQMDRISSGDTVIPSGHHNLSHSPEGRLMAEHFLSTHLAGQTEILNPYQELNTPILE